MATGSAFSNSGFLLLSGDVIVNSHGDDLHDPVGQPRARPSNDGRQIGSKFIGAARERASPHPHRVSSSRPAAIGEGRRAMTIEASEPAPGVMPAGQDAAAGVV